MKRNILLLLLLVRLSAAAQPYYGNSRNQVEHAYDDDKDKDKDKDKYCNPKHPKYNPALCHGNQVPLDTHAVWLAVAGVGWAVFLLSKRKSMLSKKENKGCLKENGEDLA